MIEKALSIITIHFQSIEGLASTCDSVEQLSKRPDIEWVVVDGGTSFKSSAEKQLYDRINEFSDCFISEPDEGIYDAMNKGVRLAKGNYLLFLNAGDRLAPNFPIQDIIEICNSEKPGMIWAHASREYADGVYGLMKYRNPRWAWIGMPVCHQSVLFSSALFKTMKYDTSLTIAGDYDLLLNTIKSGTNIYFLNRVLAEFAAGGRSQQQAVLSRKERNSVRQKYYKISTLLNSSLSYGDRIVARINSFSPTLYRTWRKWF